MLADTQHLITRRTLSVLVAAFLATGCSSSAVTAHHTPQNRADVKKLVASEAARMQMPISLALAIAHAESNFNPRARSHKGARGVMQIMPATARGEYGIQAHQLWNPRINVRLGLHFLRRLIDRYDGRVDLALSYYNGGSAVDRLGRHRPRVIPYTRKYVAKVQRLQRYYRRQLQSGSV
ncbi:MAG: transglycosylase SLT domain-containing protein [Alphaproteobacteria bacterium]|nr:transglycosylase SLT domain-containing protein [Alphaproteobacteria bacterium]